MDEGWIKAATLAHVRAANGRRRKPVVTAEFTLGSSGVRADLAIFADTAIGVEIKTAKDTLRRLPSQMDAYARYFHHVIAVVAPCHLKNVRHEHLSGASLWTYDDAGSLSVITEGSVNSVHPNTLQDVLTQAECRNGDFKTAMKARYCATSQRFWREVGRRVIRPDDLPLLSRFSDEREQARRWAAEREARWADWLAAQDGVFLASA